MKRFIITIMCVSVFFIGIGSIIEKTGAKFKSDAKAMEIINKARIAIGGDANLKNVESMSIAATTTNFFEKDGVQNTEQGSLEINMQLPAQFSKMVKIGDPANNSNRRIEIIKEVEVGSTDGKELDIASEDGTKKKVFVIKKDDGTTEEIKIEGKKRIRITKDTNGNVLTEDIDETDGDANTFVFKSDDGNVVTEDIENIDGKKVIIMKDRDGNVTRENIVGPQKMKFETHSGMRGNEMLRTTIALLLTAPTGMDVTYKFAGMGNVDGNSSNIIDVSNGGSSFKLYINASTNLPQMVSYEEHKNVFVMKKEGVKDMSDAEIIAMKEKMRDAKPVVHQLKFSDFRNVGSILFPHRWTESVNGKQSQNIDITSFEINPANIADKFGKQKMFVRKMKSTN